MDRTVVLALAIAAMTPQPHAEAEPPATIIHEPILPVASAPSLPPAKVALGKRLFHDRRLSADGTVACSDCHDLARGGADGRPLAVGVHGRVGTVNTPTVFNADPSVLDAQVDGPLLNRNEMDGMWVAALEKLRADPEYVVAFGGKPGISPTTVREAITTYERTLVTPGSRFDRWLGGETHAISDQERDGYSKFKSYGCIDCHRGRDVGGLRLAAKTAPYFRDGSIPDLETAIIVMGDSQLGIRIPPSDVAAITAFVRTLSPE